MKAGILTCHDVFNYGSSLQALALTEKLRALGADVRIIDYKPDYMYRLLDFMAVDSPKWQSALWRRWAYRLRLLPTHLSRIPKFLRYRRFNRRYLPLTKKRYTRPEELKDLTGFDAFICGSDQIWASVKNKCGEDGAFFLSFADNEKKIAYAASFGAAEISEKGEECVKKYLPGFDAIGVRETSGVEILGKYGISARQVLDPVFLMEREYWDGLAKPPRGVPESYVLSYGYDSAVDLDALAAQQGGAAVVSLNGGSRFGEYGPEEFLYLIKNARLVVTSSFHAVAFCLLFETPFLAVQTGNAALFERLESILALTGLEDRIWQAGKPLPGTVDFSWAAERLAKARRESEDFLREALHGSKDI